MSTNSILHTDLSYAYIAYKSLDLRSSRITSPYIREAVWELDSCGRPYLIADSDPLQTDFGIFGATIFEASRYLANLRSMFIVVPSSLHARDSLVLHEEGWRSLSATVIGIVKEFDFANASRILSVPTFSMEDSVKLARELEESGYPQLPVNLKFDRQLAINELISSGNVSAIDLLKSDYTLQDLVHISLRAQKATFVDLAQFIGVRIASQYVEALLENQYPAFLLDTWFFNFGKRCIKSICTSAAFCMRTYEEYERWVRRTLNYRSHSSVIKKFREFYSKDAFIGLLEAGTKRFDERMRRFYNWYLYGKASEYELWQEVQDGDW